MSDVIEQIEKSELLLFSVTPFGSPWPEINKTEELLQLAKQGKQMQWVSVAERLPENKVGKYKVADFTVVLCTDGKQWYKSYYVKHHEIDCEDMSYEGDGEYDEKTDTYYWPEGWYECSSEYEDTDWALGAVITHWMPLPPNP